MHTTLVPRFSWTSRQDGDFAVDLGDREPTWTWLRQEHADRVVVVTAPGEHAGEPGDAAVTATAGCPLAVRSADCAPVVLLGAHSVGVAHAGWRGLASGVVEQTVAAMRGLDDEPRVAHLGPCIRVGCYEFDGPELADLVERYGPSVQGTTTWGTPAMDLPAAVARALADCGVPELQDTSGCTGCDRRWFSRRVHRDPECFATIAWLEEV